MDLSQVKKRQMLWGAKGSKPADPLMAAAASSSASSSGPLNFTAATSATEKEVAKVSGSAGLPAGVIMPKQKVPTNSPFKQSFNKWENTNFGDSNTNEKFRQGSQSQRGFFAYNGCMICTLCKGWLDCMYHLHMFHRTASELKRVAQNRGESRARNSQKLLFFLSW